MDNTYIYKQQGDGRHSWICITPDGNKYMVYEDPFKKENISNLDIDSLTDEQILKLKVRLDKIK